MKKRLLLLFLTLLLLCGCSKSSVINFTGFVPAFSVSGDVADVVTVNRESEGLFKWTQIENGDNKLPAILLSDVLATASPRAKSYSILLIGSDGLASMISGDEDLIGCYIAYSDQYAWECINFNHPVSSRIKMLSEIVVISNEDAADSAAVGLVDAGGSRTITAGGLQLASYEFTLNPEGHSEINGRGVSVFTPKKRLPVSSLLDIQGTTAFVGRDGFVINGGQADFLEIMSNSLKYEEIEDVAGVMTNAPSFNISEVYSDSLHMLERDESVMIILLDGFGWEMFLHENRPLPGGADAMTAMSVFPPISPVSLATMLTGELPSVHGIHSRSDREPVAADDLFSRTAAMGKKAMYIEGDSSLIKTSLPPILSPDLNGSFGTDDEVFENAKIAIAENPDLLFVHLHGIDDTSHTYGPYAPETSERISYINELVAELSAIWNGKIIITADHGQHETADGGNHGVFCAEDMLVPYIITGGKK